MNKLKLLLGAAILGSFALISSSYASVHANHAKSSTHTEPKSMIEIDENHIRNTLQKHDKLIEEKKIDINSAEYKKFLSIVKDFCIKRIEFLKAWEETEKLEKFKINIVEKFPLSEQDKQELKNMIEKKSDESATKKTDEEKSVLWAASKDAKNKLKENPIYKMAKKEALKDPEYLKAAVKKFESKDEKQKPWKKFKEQHKDGKQNGKANIAKIDKGNR